MSVWQYGTSESSACSPPLRQNTPAPPFHAVSHVQSLQQTVVNPLGLFAAALRPYGEAVSIIAKSNFVTFWVHFRMLCNKINPAANYRQSSGETRNEYANESKSRV